MGPENAGEFHRLSLRDKASETNSRGPRDSDANSGAAFSSEITRNFLNTALAVTL
jgi:hypothetical protein